MRQTRCSIDVHGLVQGVGFRPFVHGLARRLALSGFIHNAPSGVHIEVEGEPSAILEFLGTLEGAHPSAAAIERIESRDDVPRGEQDFRIVPSNESGIGASIVAADRATCDDCVRELLAPEDRRFSHPFITCTQCGPRATIILEMPYDRPRTTMANFGMCARCGEEYASATDRRFHAQPIACLDCGPALKLVGASDAGATTPLATFAAEIGSGRIGALKGVGGFHLICDATNDDAVGELRRRKRRDTKPFAVMVRDLASAERLGDIDERARDWLASPARPIVLVDRRSNDGVSALVAPDVRTLGLMLPYTPIHHLLFSELGDLPLVVTSGNASNEPIACTDEEALEHLGDIADLFLTHDRAISLRSEDSIVRVAPETVTPIRRSRGYAPLPVDLGFTMSLPTLAVGGHGKAVFGLGVGKSAFLSPHFGDLDGLRAYSSWTNAIRHFERLFRVRPARLVHDLHPDYASTRYATERFVAEGLELVAVQHHHAHLASCMVDNSLQGDVIGVCFDGTGLGTDGTLWGGEFLVGGFDGFSRAGHLSEIALPGGDRAAREPWRVAVSHLRAAGRTPASVGLHRRIDPQRISSVERLLTSDACARTTSMGRLFDAVAGITGVVDHASYEAEAGMQLEALAASSDDRGTYPVDVTESGPFVVDTSNLIAGIADDVERGVSRSITARRFHTAIVDLVERVCTAIRASSSLDRVVLTGGVFANAVLSREVTARLKGFSVFAHRTVPPNDGGLCLGQLAVASRRVGHFSPASSARERSH